MPDSAPERQLVRRTSSLEAQWFPVRELERGSAMGDSFLVALIRAQFWLAVRFFAVLALFLGGSALFLVVTADRRAMRIVGLPIGWLLLGSVSFVCFVAIGARYVFRAERLETEFVDFAAVNAKRENADPGRSRG